MSFCKQLYDLIAKFEFVLIFAECRTGEAVILYIDHAEENLILSNRHEVVNFALKEKKVEVRLLD